ncbi:MAG TPA: hypothetical protein VJQ52_19195 [Steroidobacteraceae bacterium]|nr:hypothetical protein [Steroidobacteraceae bacterium]
MEIDVVKLKSIIDRLLDHVIETRGVRRVELGSDLYWDMSEEVLYNVVDQPQELDIGRLSDDWELLSTMLEEDATPVAYQLTEVAPLLRRLGEVLGKDLAAKGG